MAELNHALAHYIDFGAAARSALGGYWDRMEPKTHAKLVDTLREHVAKRLSLFLFDGSSHAIIVGDPSDVTHPGAGAMVPARLTLAPGNALPLGFMMADQMEKPRIVDVIVGGISLMNMLGDECRAVVQNQGVDGLMARLAE